MTRRYAQATEVPISRSRGQIDKLLRDWGATGVQWTDEFDKDRVTLRFIWKRGVDAYNARFSIQLPKVEHLRQSCVNRYGKVAEGRLSKLVDARGKQEHRVLLLWLTAAFNAVDMGLTTPETLFLPFFEGSDGKTVAEIAAPLLPKLQVVSAKFLLSSGEG